MIRNPKELTSAQLMIALVAILCELSDRLGLIQNANLDTLSASLAASPNLNSEVPVGTPDAGAPEISGIDAAGANPAPAYATSEAGSDLSVLFDADGDTATTGVATRPLFLRYFLLVQAYTVDQQSHTLLKSPLHWP